MEEFLKTKTFLSVLSSSRVKSKVVKMSKKITKSGFLAWPEDLRKQLEVKYNEEETHVIHAQCILCKNHVLVTCL